MKKLLSILLCIISLTSLGGCNMDEKQKRAKQQAELYFGKAKNSNVTKVARYIAADTELSNELMAKIKKDINNRYHRDITLLFFALKKRNLQAIDKLLEYEASPYLPDKSKGSIRSFIYYIVSAGENFDFTLEVLKLYLKHGGDPDHDLADHHEPIIVSTATMDNFSQFKILIEAGADVWADADKGTSHANNALETAGMLTDNHSFIYYSLDKGLFDNVDKQKIFGLMHFLSMYKQRGDKLSLDIQKVTRVIMEKTEYAGDQYTQKILAGKQTNGKQ